MSTSSRGFICLLSAEFNTTEWAGAMFLIGKRPLKVQGTDTLGRKGQWKRLLAPVVPLCLEQELADVCEHMAFVLVVLHYLMQP